MSASRVILKEEVKLQMLIYKLSIDMKTSLIMAQTMVCVMYLSPIELLVFTHLVSILLKHAILSLTVPLLSYHRDFIELSDFTRINISSYIDYLSYTLVLLEGSSYHFYENVHQSRA